MAYVSGCLSSGTWNAMPRCVSFISSSETTVLNSFWGGSAGLALPGSGPCLKSLKLFFIASNALLLLKSPTITSVILLGTYHFLKKLSICSRVKLFTVSVNPITGLLYGWVVNAVERIFLYSVRPGLSSFILISSSTTSSSFLSSLGSKDECCIASEIMSSPVSKYLLATARGYTVWSYDV